MYVSRRIEEGNKIIACIEIKYSATSKLTKGNLIALNSFNCRNNYIITPKVPVLPDLKFELTHF